MSTYTRWNEHGEIVEVRHSVSGKPVQNSRNSWAWAAGLVFVAIVAAHIVKF